MDHRRLVTTARQQATQDEIGVAEQGSNRWTGQSARFRTDTQHGAVCCPGTSGSSAELPQHPQPQLRPHHLK